METENETLADRLNREVDTSGEKSSDIKSAKNELNQNNVDTKENENDKKLDFDAELLCTDYNIKTNNETEENKSEIQENGDNCDEVSSAIKVDHTTNDIASNDNGDSCTIEEKIKADSSGDIKGDNEEEFVDLSEDSGSDAEYESAEEGEEIQVDKENLKELENSLTDEEKEERRNSAQKLKEEGNELFRCGSYKSAIRVYSRALRTCPLKFARDRSIMYSNRGACKMRLEDYDESIRDCSKALDLHPVYLKALMRRAELYEKTEKLDEALADFQKIIELDPSQHTARAACMRLPDQIKERNEKLKEEMMGKLKDLGNMVLRPFGLSTNNFQMKQDPATGGYSVNFVQNADQK